MTMKPAFGQLQTYASPRAHAGGGHAPSAYAPPQTSDYTDIVKDVFGTTNSPGGVASPATPVKGLRFASGLIDYIFLTVFGSLTVGGYMAVKSLRTGAEPHMTLPIFGMMILIWISYGFVMEASKFQGTVGKILTGTVVVNEDGSALSIGQVIGRNFGKILSTVVPFCIPYFMVLFTESNQSLHDKMCRSFVYKKSDLQNIGDSVFD